MSTGDYLDLNSALHRAAATAGAARVLAERLESPAVVEELQIAQRAFGRALETLAAARHQVPSVSASGPVNVSTPPPVPPRALAFLKRI